MPRRKSEIGTVKGVNTQTTVSRPRRTMIGLNTMDNMSDAAPTNSEIGTTIALNTVTAVSRRRRTSFQMETEMSVSDAAPIEAETAKTLDADIRMSLASTPSGDRLNHEDPLSVVASEMETMIKVTPVVSLSPSPLSATINGLVARQKIRRFCIKSQQRTDRATEAFIARYLGYRNELTAEERKKLFQQAAKLRRDVEKGDRSAREHLTMHVPPADGGGHLSLERQKDDVLSVCTPIILNGAVSRNAWDNLRDNTEAEMRKMARTLPVYDFCKQIKGFGDLGLGIIIGETGDLSGYATHQRVWKRLGLAVIEGERQQRKSGEDWKKHQYNPERRAEIWTLADSMFKHQWTGDKDEDGKNPRLTGKPTTSPAHATGRYGEVYKRRKDHTQTREWSGAHQDADARRVMMKTLIMDLWADWRRGVKSADEFWEEHRNWIPE